VCTEKDCSIFRGMLIACDACEKRVETKSQVPNMARPGLNPPSPP
jgi:hypothetical protein